MNVLMMMMLAAFTACQSDEFCRMSAQVQQVHAVRVYVSPLVGDLLGMTIGQQVMVTTPKAVRVQSTPLLVDRAGQLDVLYHEIGHALQPTALRQTPRGELFAELVSERVHRELGRRKVVPWRALHPAPSREWKVVELLYAGELDTVVSFLTGIAKGGR